MRLLSQAAAAAPRRRLKTCHVSLPASTFCPHRASKRPHSGLAPCPGSRDGAARTDVPPAVAAQLKPRVDGAFTSASRARWGEVAASDLARRRNASSGLNTSHSPSHARSSSSPSCTRTTRTSGLGTTRLSVKGSPASLVSSHRLKSRSPMARDTASARMTRPPATQPPAAVMRAVSSARSGLWSTVSCSTLPSRHK
eukprot:scaffold5174_cov118-Isochrysis_galbana.AAC.7